MDTKARRRVKRKQKRVRKGWRQRRAEQLEKLHAEGWMTEDEGELQYGLPKEFVEVLSGRNPRAKGSRAQRSQRRRILLDFLGQVIGFDIWSGPSGTLPGPLCRLIEENLRAMEAGKADRTYGFDDPAGHPLFCTYAYLMLIGSDPDLDADIMKAVKLDFKAGRPAPWGKQLQPAMAAAGE